MNHKKTIFVQNNKLIPHPTNLFDFCQTIIKFVADRPNIFPIVSLMFSAF